MPISYRNDNLCLGNLTTESRDAIESPTVCNWCFNTDTGQFEFYNGTIWTASATELPDNDLNEVYQYLGDGNALVPAKSRASLNNSAFVPTLVIDVDVNRNEKSISSDSTFTFSGVPYVNGTFALKINNTSSAWRKVTVPSSYSDAQKGDITETWVPPGQTYLSWLYDGSKYFLFGDYARADNSAATTDPATGDDELDGYAIGSEWINTATNDRFVCTDATAASAVWRKTTNTVESIPTGISGAVKINNIVEISQVDYDALGTPDASTLFVLTS